MQKGDGCSPCKGNRWRRRDRVLIRLTRRRAETIRPRRLIPFPRSDRPHSEAESGNTNPQTPIKVDFPPKDPSTAGSYPLTCSDPGGRGTAPRTTFFPPAITDPPAGRLSAPLSCDQVEREGNGPAFPAKSSYVTHKHDNL